MLVTQIALGQLSALLTDRNPCYRPDSNLDSEYAVVGLNKGKTEDTRWWFAYRLQIPNNRMLLGPATMRCGIHPESPVSSVATGTMAIIRFSPYRARR